MLKGYTAPRTPLGRSSLVQPPPWHYVGTALAVEYDARPEAVAAFLPAPLRPGREALAGRCAAYFCDWQFASGEAAAGGEPEYLDPVHSQYREFILLLTAEFEGSPCAYCPFIWVDQDASLLRGLIQGCRSPSVPRRRPRPALAAGEPVDLTPLGEVDRRHILQGLRGCRPEPKACGAASWASTERHLPASLRGMVRGNRPAAGARVAGAEHPGRPAAATAAGCPTPFLRPHRSKPFLFGPAFGGGIFPTGAPPDPEQFRAAAIGTSRAQSVARAAGGGARRDLRSRATRAHLVLGRRVQSGGGRYRRS